MKLHQTKPKNGGHKQRICMCKINCGNKLPPNGILIQILLAVTSRTTRSCRIHGKKGDKTSCTNRYTATIFNPSMWDNLNTDDLLMQPVPDYIRWFKTWGKLYYLPVHKIQKPQTLVIDDTPGAFLPSKVLEMILKSLTKWYKNVLPSIAFLSWCSEDDVRQAVFGGI